MKPQMKVALFGTLILLLAACASAEPASTLQPVVTENAVEAVTEPAGGAVPDAVGKYVGLNYPPLPEGLSDEVSMLIQDAEDYSLWIISDGTNRMMWLGKMTHRDAGGNAFWQVKDTLDLSEMASGTNLLLNGCSLNGTPDHEVLVLGQGETIIRAWRANTTSSLFEEIATVGLECHSDIVVNF